MRPSPTWHCRSPTSEMCWSCSMARFFVGASTACSGSQQWSRGACGNLGFQNRCFPVEYGSRIVVKVPRREHHAPQLRWYRQVVARQFGLKDSGHHADADPAIRRLCGPHQLVIAEGAARFGIVHALTPSSESVFDHANDFGFFDERSSDSPRSVRRS